MNAATKNQLVLWATGLGILAVFVWAGVLISQARSIDSQYTQPGVADYQNGNYSKAIQELNTSVKLNSGDSHAYYYLGLSLKKTGNVSRARRVFMAARETEAHSRNHSVAFEDRCRKEINDIDDGH